MSDKKNIDRLFQEKLKDFEATPNDSVWDNISAELHSAKKRRKVISIWWRAAGIAAALLLLFAISQLMLNNNISKSTQETITDVDSEKNPLINDLQDVIGKENILAEEENVPEDLTSKSSDFKSKSTESNTATTQTQNYNSAIESKDRNVTVNTKPKNDDSNTSNIDRKGFVTSSSPTKNAIVENSTSNLTQGKTQNNAIDIVKIDAILNNTKTKGNSETTLANSINNNIEGEDAVEEEKLSLVEEVVANEEEDIEDPKEEEFERWKAASNIAPVYFNTLGKGSSIHPQFNDNSKTGNINMSYGVSGSYAINKKLSVRAGVNKVNLGYSTNNVVVFNNIGVSSDTQLLRNIDFNETAQNLSFISAEEFNFVQVPSVLSNVIDSSVEQKLGFIEVPLELEYNISDKKTSINIIGGFSALFLNDNEVYSVIEGKNTLLGKATNINNTSFSANLGLGFDFKIANKFNFNLEPVFKYQLNTFNNTSGNFKPFFIGVYSGLSFKF